MKMKNEILFMMLWYELMISLMVFFEIASIEVDRAFSFYILLPLIGLFAYEALVVKDG